MKIFKLTLLSLFYMMLFVFSLSSIADVKQKKESNKELKSYSFRPLLIQGKKRLVQKTKDLKLETDNILETKIFFVDTDFKERIFFDEGFE